MVDFVPGNLYTIDYPNFTMGGKYLFTRTNPDCGEYGRLELVFLIFYPFEEIVNFSLPLESGYYFEEVKPWF